MVENQTEENDEIRTTTNIAEGPEIESSNHVNNNEEGKHFSKENALQQEEFLNPQGIEINNSPKIETISSRNEIVSA
eukprot:Awhi_evm1s15606